MPVTMVCISEVLPVWKVALTNIPSRMIPGF